MAYLDLIGGGELIHAKLAVKAFFAAPWLTAAWRSRFKAIGRSLATACPGWCPEDGDEAEDVADTGTVRTDNAQLFIDEVDTQAHRVRLKQRSLREGSVRLACYVVDVELTFSSSPFASSAQSGASYVTAIAPTITCSVSDGSDADGWVPLPEDMRRKQMVLEVSGAASVDGRCLSASKPCYFCDATVAFDEQCGTLRLEEQGKPTSGAYVKVFMGGPKGANPRFYKDGYTDCAGSFDYISLNAERPPVKQNGCLSVLVLTRASGALVREVAVPPLVRNAAVEAETPAMLAFSDDEATVFEEAFRNGTASPFTSSGGEEEE